MSSCSESLNIIQWQELVEKSNATKGAPHTKIHAPLAMRCEDTHFTVGWKEGGFRLSGHIYTPFCPKAVFGPCAMLAVRDDFLVWVKKFISGEAENKVFHRPRKKKSNPDQQEFEL